jgi:ketosteroid isomerase-like protein
VTLSLDPHVNITENLVRHFWALMAKNDFAKVGEILTEDFTIEWPQTNERIRGAGNFARFNQDYPAHGPWTFEVQIVVAQGADAVSRVVVSDGVQGGEPISFFRFRDELICSIIEYWPEASKPATERAHLTEPLTGPPAQ